MNIQETAKMREWMCAKSSKDTGIEKIKEYLGKTPAENNIREK